MRAFRYGSCVMAQKERLCTDAKLMRVMGILTGEQARSAREIGFSMWKEWTEVTLGNHRDQSSILLDMRKMLRMWLHFGISSTDEVNGTHKELHYYATW